MAKNELSYGGFNFDKGLDIDFDDPSPKSVADMSKREIVQDLSKGTVKGVGKTLKNIEKWKTAVREELPKPFKESWKTYDDAASTVSDLYDHARKEVKPALGQIAKNLDDMVPKGFQRAKKVTGFLKDKLYEAPGKGDPTAAEMQNRAVDAMLGEVFKGLNTDVEETQIEAKKARERKIADDAVSEQISKDRHDQSIQLFSRMDSNVQKLALYQEKVGIAVQRKSLEIGFRQYALLADIAQQMRNSEGRQAEQLKMLIHNSGLPEYRKIKMGERFLDSAKKRTVEGINGKVFGPNSIIGGAKEKLSKDFKEGISKFRTNLEAALMGLETVKDSGDTLEMTGDTVPSAIGDFGGQWIGDAIRTKLLKKLMPKMVNDPAFKKFGNKLGRAAINPNYGIEQLKETEAYKKLADGKYGSKVDSVMNYIDELLKVQKGNGEMEGGSTFKGMLEPENYTKRLNVVQTEVVPGYLARILREVTMVRTGKDTPLLSFDAITGKFKDSGAIKSGLKTVIDKQFENNTGIKDIVALAETLKTEMGLEEGSNEALIKLITSLMNSNKTFSGKSIRGSKAYEQASELHKKIFDTVSDKMDQDTDEQASTTYKYESGMRDIRGNLESGGVLIQQLIDAGYRDQLLEMGIVSKTDDGSLQLNEENVRQRIEDRAIQTSDVEAKKGFKTYSGKKALEGIKRLAVSAWKYKDKAKGTHQKIGPMAQDLQRELGDDVAPGGKKVDLVSANGANMAAIQELAKGQEALKEELGGEAPTTGGKKWRQIDYLNAINRNIVAMHQTLKNKNFMLGMPGVDFSKMQMPSIDLKDAASKAKEMAKPVIETGNKYIDAIQSLVQTGLNEGFQSFKRGADWIQSNVFVKGKDSAKEFWANNKNGLKEKKDWLVEKSINFFGKAFDFGSDVLAGIPNALRSSFQGLINVKDKAKAFLNGPVDVYITGNTSPVLLASRMRAGVYASAKDGKVIQGVDDLLNTKADIIDLSKNNEIALRWSDAADGLYDQNGKKLQTLGGIATTLAVGAAAWTADKAMGAVKKLMNTKPNLAGIKETLKGMGSSLTSKFKGLGGFSLSDARQLGLLAQIRDLLAIGKKQKLVEHVYSRKLDDEKYLEGSGFLAMVYGDKIKKFFGGSGNSEGSAGSTSEATSEGGGGSQEPTNLGSIDGLINGAKNFANSISEQGGIKNAYRNAKAGIEGTDEFVGPSQPGGKGGFIGRQYGKLKNAASTMPGSGIFRKLKGRISGPGEGFVGPSKPSLMGKLANGRLGKMAMGGWSKGAGLLKGLGGMAMGALGGIGSGLQSMFGGETENQITDNETGSALTSVYNKAGVTKSIGDGTAGKSTFSDRDGDGSRDGGSTEQLKRFEDETKQRKEQNAAKAAEASKRAQESSLRYKSKENAIDTLIKSAGGLLSSLKAGASGLFDTASGVMENIPGIGKFLKRGLPKAWGAAKGLGRLAMTKGGKALSIARGAVTGVRAAGLLGTANKVFTVARTVGMATSGVGGTVVAAGATILQGALAVVASPLFIKAAIIAGVGYGLYKGYKYFTRNSLDDFEKFRAIQYGLNKDSKDLYKVMNLEGYFLDGRLTYTGGRITFNQQKVKPDELLDLMDINKDDKKRAKEFGIWLTERFAPFFLGHLMALFAVDPKAKLSDVSKLSKDQLKTYLDKAQKLDGPYDVAESPFESQESMENTKADIPELVEALVSKAKDKTKEGKKSLKDEISSNLSVVKEIEDRKQKQADEAKKSLGLKDSEKVTPRPAKTNPGQKSAASQALDSNLRGDDSGKETNGSPGGTFASNDDKSYASSLNKARGPLFSDKEGMPHLSFYKGAKIDGLHPSVRRNLLAMAAEFGTTTGKKVVVTDGSRTFEEQKVLYDRMPGKAAKPGSSMHEFGMAIDIDSGVADQLEKLGLFRKYGFTRPVGGEKWHVEPAGVQLDINKAKQDPNWALQQIEASPGRGGGGYATMADSAMKRRNPSLAKALFTSASDNTVDLKAKETSGGADGPIVETESNTKPASGGLSSGNIPSATDKNPSGPTASKGLAIASGPGGGSAPMEEGEKSATGSAGAPKETIKGYTAEFGSKSANDPAFAKAGGGNSPGVEKTKEIIKVAAGKAGMDPNVLQLFAAAESSMGQNQSPHTGSAQGPFQFMPATWKETVGKHGSKYGITPSTPPTDTNASALMTAEYLKQNKKNIQKYKATPDIIDYYLSHMLGGGGVQTFLAMAPDEIAATKMPKAANSNPNIFFKGGNKSQPLTAAGVRQVLVDKFNKLSQTFGVDITIPGEKLGNINEPAKSSASSGVASVTPNAYEGKAPGNSGSSSMASMPTGSSGASSETMAPSYSSPAPEAKTRNKVEDRKPAEETLRGQPDIASGVASILERNLEVDTQLLNAVQNDVVPVLKGMHDTLLKIYSAAGGKDGGGSNETSPDVKNPSVAKKPPQTVASSASVLDRTRRYG